jgi:hypothetical protein
LSTSPSFLLSKPNTSESIAGGARSGKLEGLSQSSSVIETPDMGLY